MLSSFPISSKDQDVGKQMASIRTYLATLKDELENELNNIGYNNLDADLRGRFDDLTDSFFSMSRQVSDVAEIIKAKYITAEEIVATYATIGSLNAATARIGSLEAADVTITGSLNALRGEFNTLNAKAITTDNLSAQTIYGSQISGLTISASQITSGTISSDRIASDVFEGRTVLAQQFSARYFNDRSGYTYGGQTVMFVTDVDFDNKTVRTSSRHFMVGQTTV